MMLYVESGTRVVDANSEVIVDTSGQADTQRTGEIRLEYGESVLVPAGTSVSRENRMDGPVTFLILFMVSGLAESEDGSNPGEMMQIAQNGLAAGSADFLQGPATITLERVVVSPGETRQSPNAVTDEYSPGWMGLDIGWVESGSANLDIRQQSMERIIWHVPDPGVFAAPEIVPFTFTIALEQGEGYSMFDSRLIWTATGDEPLTILRVVVTPFRGD